MFTEIKWPFHLFLWVRRYFTVPTHRVTSLASFLKVTIYYKSLRSEAFSLFLIKTILQIYDIHEKIYSIPRKILYTYFVCVAAEQLLLNLNTIFCYLFRQFVIQYLTFIIFVKPYEKKEKKYGEKVTVKNYHTY